MVQLEIEIPPIGWLGIAVLAFFIVAFINIVSSLKDKSHNFEIKVTKLEGEILERNTFIEKVQADAKGYAQEIADKLFLEWKEKELQAHREVIFGAANETARAALSNWMIEEEQKFRKDAVTRSMGVNFGKITEHLLPFSKHLEQFDPRDIRFIGSPVDLMIFSGATAKKSVIDIYFVEIKTGAGQLSKKQKTIRDALLPPNPRVHWLPITVPEFKWDIPDEDVEDEPEPSTG